MAPGKLNPLSRPSRLLTTGALLLGIAACGQDTPPPTTTAKQATPPKAEPAAQPKTAAASEQPAATATGANEALAARVKQALVANKVKNAHAIDVVVAGGAVTLFGTVDNAEGREMAVKIASGVEGVESVRHKLVVVSGS
jgi:osmotically-inducible protein OsmY